jgi:drug/metabolite transporter (DMT)-like permease
LTAVSPRTSTASAPPQAQTHASPALYAALALMTALWGMNYYSAKVVTAEFTPFTSAALRSVLSGLVIVPYYFFFRPSEKRPPIPRRAAIRLMLLGCIGIGLNQFCFLAGMQRTSIAHGSLIIAITPAIVVVLACLMGQERLHRATVLGIVIAFAGAALLQWNSASSAANARASTLAGDLTVLCASCAFATYTVLAKQTARQFGIAAANAWAFLGSSLALLPGLLYQLPALASTPISAKGWAGVLYMSYGTSILCMMIYQKGLSVLPASRVSALSYLQPLIAIATAVPLLGEPVTPNILAGGALILAGVLYAERG